VIESIEIIEIRLPLRRDSRWRGLTEEIGRSCVIRVHDSEGRIGHGEATALASWGGDWGSRYGETPTTVRHIVGDLLAPALRGVQPFEIERAGKLMDDAVRGHVYAKAAVEMALWDLQGLTVGLPAYKLLGGAVRDGVVVSHMLGIMRPSDAVAEATAAAAEGIRAFQVKGTGEANRDVELIRALRAALGPDILLRLDANQGYRGLGGKATAAIMRRLEEAGVDMIEQPGEGVREMARAHSAASVPVIADESCWSPHDVVELAERDAADVISIYLAKAGGIAGAKRVATLAAVYGFPCDVNGSLESAIGNAANLHFAISTPAVTLPCVIPATSPGPGVNDSVAGNYYTDDLVSVAFPFRDGILHPPDGPGLGIVIDEDRLDAYRV
jgi:L-alanine-DL-glutamate epimerase-like enolase superfamily enzyme